MAAVTPQPYVRLWFDHYLDAIRVAPLRPYLLYNSWYDLRSRDYVKEHLTGEDRDVMTTANILRVAHDFQTRFCEPYGIPLDAFVLDDGWDVYESDWQLRDPEFPGRPAPRRRRVARRSAPRLGHLVRPHRRLQLPPETHRLDEGSTATR